MAKHLEELQQVPQDKAKDQQLLAMEWLRVQEAAQEKQALLERERLAMLEEQVLALQM